ncbi:MAG: protease inhibitor I42 family protein [Akkermansia sp.]
MPEPAESVVLELAVGEERVALELPSNPTTGFQWELAEPQRSAVVAVELSYVAPQQPEGEELLCGAPGVMQVRLRGLQPGTERVLLHYRRCWEADVPPAEQCVLQVRVRE